MGNFSASIDAKPAEMITRLLESGRIIVSGVGTAEIIVQVYS